MEPKASGMVGGLFIQSNDAERAVQELQDAGFEKKEIGLAVREGGAGQQLAATEGGKQEHEQSEEFWSRMEEEFGGPRSSASGTDMSAGLPEDRAQYFMNGVMQGKILVTVDAGDRAGEAEQILSRCGADLGGAIAPAAAAPPVGTTSAEPGNQRIELVGEVLRVGKTAVPAGEARIRKEVVTETQHVQVPVSHEELVVEREPGTGQPASRPVGAEGGEIRVPLTREEPQVKKETVQEGVVDVAKKKIEEVRSITEKLRHEKAEVEGEERPETRRPPERAA
ncbi:MAG TPA: DUF2382 domain-containing protein [Terriglobales bacterium]|nr:DUF2382 domain-containing protein [Terriglobales bacterium]